MAAHSERLAVKTERTARGNFPQSGRLAIVGEEPLLECRLNPEGRPSLVLYGQPGWRCGIEQGTDLLEAAAWSELERVTLGELLLPLAIPGTDDRSFYRAVRWPATRLSEEP